MPTMTRDDVDDLNMFVKAGRIDEARALLMRLDGEKAQNALQRLNERYPPSAKGDLIAEAKRLIAQKDYDAAEALLWDSDDPTAGELLRKLALVRSAGVKASPGQPTVSMKPKEKPGSHRVRNLFIVFVLAVVVGCGALLFVVNQQSASIANEINISFALRRICIDAYLDEYAGKLTTDQFYDGCTKEVESMMIKYTATVDRCYATWSDEQYKMTECLVDGGAKFSGVYMLTAGS
jgi:hypothetical protein